MSGDPSRDYDGDVDSVEDANRRERCDLCFGNGFIYAGPTADPCPKCWGEGEVAADDLDTPPV